MLDENGNVKKNIWPKASQKQKDKLRMANRINPENKSTFARAKGHLPITAMSNTVDGVPIDPKEEIK